MIGIQHYHIFHRLHAFRMRRFLNLFDLNDAPVSPRSNKAQTSSASEANESEKDTKKLYLTIRTDNPQAEIGLYDTESKEVAYEKWQAHRELSSTILGKIKKMLEDNSIDFDGLTGVVYYEGPGSFTGLRIGASVANALERAVANSSGDDWQKKGVDMLKNGKKSVATPQYGAEPHITKQKK